MSLANAGDDRGRPFCIDPLAAPRVRRACRPQANRGSAARKLFQ